jgi:hypothetical protein
MSEEIRLLREKANREPKAKRKAQRLRRRCHKKSSRRRRELLAKKEYTECLKLETELE